MSEHITHLAICDDGVRLAARHPEVPSHLHEVLARHHDVARPGAVTRSADRRSADLIAWALAKALDYLVAAGRLYEGTVTVDEAKRRFDVGVPELTLAFPGSAHTR